MKKSKKDDPKQPKKVFDVMRPGKTAAQATSRPVIVGHKPQVKDPMMSNTAEAEALMDSKKKVALQPANETAASAAVSTEQPPQQKAEAPESHDGPYVADEIASLATTSAVEKVPEGAEVAQQLATPLDAPKAAEEAISSPTPVAQPATTETPEPPAEKQAEAQPTTDSNTGTTGVVFDEVPDFETLTGTKPNANASVEPLPELPEDKAVVRVPKVVVSHHNYSNGWAKFFITFFILAVIAVIVIDVLLDTGLLVKNGLPHTNFFQ